MVVGEIAEPVDLLVVGGGPGGYVAALRAAQLGREVTLVERGGTDGLGGVCLHVGCIPSKALIELAHAAHGVSGMRSAGLVTGDVAVDLMQFQGWKKRIIGGLASGVSRLLADRRVRVMHGTARFSRSDRAAIEAPDGRMTYVEFKQAIVATGSRPAALSQLPVDGERVVDSTGALALEELPSSVAIVGAGYIGMEIGMALAKLGVAVTVVEALERILPAVGDSLIRPVVRRAQELGMTMHTSARVSGLDHASLVVQTAKGEIRCAAEKVIVAVGRLPNTDEIGLANAGVETNAKGLIVVDEARRSTPTIAAIGDVVEGSALAHKASAEARVAAEALCGLPAAFDPTAIPAVIFTDPEIATVGLTATEAESFGFDVAVASFPLSASGRAATLGARRGSVQIVADRTDNRVVGVHIVGPNASELVAEGALAIEMMAAPEDIAGTIHPHPTISEAIAEAAALLGRPAHLLA